MEVDDEVIMLFTEAGHQVLHIGRKLVNLVDVWVCSID
jgi:CO dehydrogenase nickel-insertion accessory protein CooC1